MSTLLVWREKLQNIYAKYSIYILKALQFVTGLIVFGLINSNIGFMEQASSVVCTAGLAVICTFFPMTIMTLAAAALVLVHFYAVSMPIAIVSLVVFLLMFIFYFRFTPKKAWIVLLSAIAFGLKIPLVIPVVFGLLGTPVWIVPASFGIISYYMIDYVKDSATALKSADAENLADSLMNFTKQLFTSKEMWLMIGAIVVGILVVHLIRTRSVDHAWKIASAAGAAVSVILLSAGSIALDIDISFAIVLASAVLGIAIGLVLEFFFFSVDYSRAENIQFEDDEYYYYVKAIPKVGVAVPEKEVKRITGNRPDRRRGPKKSDDEQDDATKTDEILLTRSLSKELGIGQEEDKTE
ncbi:MAG TPA: hypothetical protein H9750_01005 [Candidatus Mediterraneibacter excrementavium]|nr:hypothetical protein [Candidatus Mediterraneibacter excrementavium]